MAVILKYYNLEKTKVATPRNSLIGIMMQQQEKTAPLAIIKTVNSTAKSAENRQKQQQTCNTFADGRN